jgi:hypothetical protein
MKNDDRQFQETTLKINTMLLSQYQCKEKNIDHPLLKVSSSPRKTMIPVNTNENKYVDQHLKESSFIVKLKLSIFVVRIYSVDHILLRSHSLLDNL